MHYYQDLITIFNECFSTDYNTQLVKGDQEPIYLPEDEHRSYHAIFFAHGFYSSALHECAHWLIAGKQRRKLVDYGYWYVPDGRTAEQQSVFQRVEVKPQAIEWILSKATGYQFSVSADNLDGAEYNTQVFKQAVYLQVLTYCNKGLTQRTNRLYQALCYFYNRPIFLNASEFMLKEL